jgi:hypothetical protein
MDKKEAIEILKKKQACMMAEDDECDLCQYCEWCTDWGQTVEAMGIAIDALTREEEQK